LRKSFLVAGVATLVLGTAGAAHAQAPEPSITATAKVAPTKSGTKSKPKNEKLTLFVKNDPASATTASKITIKLPSTLALSTKGLTQCTANDDRIVSTVGSVCKSANIGSGKANALVLANNLAVVFNVTAFAGKNELLILLTSEQVGNKYVLHGKIKGRTLTIAIPEEVQQPLAGLYAALVDLKVTLSKKKGKSYLIKSTGCKSKKHTLDVTVGYAPNPNPPSKSSASTKAVAKCS
jgi:hypothetical protein